MAGSEVQLVAACAEDVVWLTEVLTALGVGLRTDAPVDVGAPTVLCVRDVRDVLAARGRGTRSSLERARALDAPEDGPVPLPPADSWALRHLTWVAVAAHADVVVLRMEDVRVSPAAEVTRLLAALGIAADTPRVARAVQNAAPPWMPLPRPERWDALPGFGGLVAHALATFGYRVDPTAPAPERTTPACLADTLAEVRARLAAGDVAAALGALVAARARHVDPAAPLALAAARLALTWTAAFVPPASAAAVDVFDATLALVLRFAPTPGLDAALLNAEVATRAAAERADPAGMRATRLRAPGDATVSPARTAELFAAGNYAAVARVGSFDAWETWAALGLLGRTAAAAEGLARFDGAAPRFWSGVAHFLAGDEPRALELLNAVDDEHARRLAALVRKPVIHVLAQVPWVRQGTQDYLSSTAGGRFHVRNVSFDDRDVPNRPYADVAELVAAAAPPDFFFTAMAEFHLLPPDLQTLACPLLAQTSDWDLYIQSVYPRLQDFDELVVSDQTEWDGVQGLVGVPVSSFPACLGVPATLPPLARTARPVDVMFSGAAIHPVYPEKARCLRDLLDLPDAAVNVVNGYPWYRRYLEALGECKVTFTNIRRSGCVPSRGLEAIGMGCALVVQRESTLTLFLGEADGLCTYDVEARDLGPTVARVLAEWDAYEQRARWGAAMARRELGMNAVADRFLRFLTVLAARPRPARHPATLPPDWEASPIAQRTGCVWRGPDVLPTAAAQTLLAENVERWRAAGDGGARATADVARELVLQYAGGRTDVASPLRDRLLSQGLGLYWQAIDRHPDRLLLRFNLVRSALHHGRPREVAAALRLAAATLAEPSERWRVAPSDDVLTHDFAPAFFNFRRYVALLTDGLRTGRTPEAALVRLVLASLEHYVGWYAGDPGRLARAVALDPEFAAYRMTLARALVDRGAPGDCERATGLLAELADGSATFPEAVELLEVLRSEGRAHGPAIDAAHTLAERLAAVGHHEDQRLGTLRPGCLPGLGAVAAEAEHP
jgi:hypothetical protein